MFQNLSLRSKLIALTTPPLAVLGAFVVYVIQMQIRGASSDIESDVSTLGFLALAAFVMTALAGISISRAVSQPLSQATSAAKELSETRLPQLLETLRNPGSPAPEFEPLEVVQNDEFGELVAALNQVQESAANLASEQQSLVRAGLRDLVVNMARRNQSLLDRQIEVIDRMEATEQDPDRLEELYSLDHLATRMRRNAESLLVLAGAEPGRRRGGPVAVADVLRVAMSEIEDYQHVELQQIEDTKIGPQGAVDLAHLASELLENATQFSPPDAQVMVRGVLHPGGSYLISISDKGIGLNEEQLAAANSVLSSPPELGLGLTRSLGFIVVGRLAKRLGVRVEIASDAGGGTTAIIEVPAAALHGYLAPQPVAAPAADADATANIEVSPPAPVQEGVGGAAELLTNSAPRSGASTSAVPTTDLATSENSRSDAPQIPTNNAAHSDPVTPSDQEAWTPPALPERGLSPLASAPSATPEESLSRDAAGIQPNIDAGTSDALAKLLGIDPFAANEPAKVQQATTSPASDASSTDTEPNDLQATSPFDLPGSADSSQPTDPWAERTGSAPSDSPNHAPSPFAAPARAAAQPESHPWTPPEFQPQELSAIAPIEEVAAPASIEPPQKLADAIGSSDAFDTGVAELLKPPPATTTSGLVKRDRTTSQAPTSEGRPIAASVRSPEEIRSMLARYRDGLKGRGDAGSLQDSAPLQQPSDLASPDLPISTTNPLDSNPFGDHS